MATKPTTTTKEHRAEYKKIMKTLAPFLPKLDLSTPPPAEDWKLSDVCSEPLKEATKNHLIEQTF